MKFVALVHKYPPAHGAGAEWMLHTILRWLAGRGHHVTVGYPFAVEGHFDGVEVVDLDVGKRLAAHADVLFTHLDVTGDAMRVARDVNRPLVHLVHNDQQLVFHQVKDAPLVIMNSQWLAAAYGWPGPQMVVRPPVFAADYATGVDPSTSTYVTLLNLTDAKGGPLFFRLAEREPGRQFLAVRGAYGVQAIPQRPPANVTIVDNTPDVVADVYARTRVLLVPSSYESWGRVAIEAASSGIPVVAHPTPGLVESLHSAGIFRDRRRPGEWQQALRWLDDPTNYARASDAVRARAEDLDPLDDLRALEDALVLVAGRRTAELHAAYAHDVIVSRSCPVCGVAGHQCGPKTDVSGVPLVIPAVRRDAGPKRTYHLDTGDWVYSLADAQRRGYAPDGDELPTSAVRRLVDLGAEAGQVRAARNRYRALDVEKKQAFLDELWPMHLSAAAAWFEKIGSADVDVDPEVDAPEIVTDVPTGRAGEVVEWVGVDADRAMQALAVERARERPRTALITKLEAVLA